LIANVHQFEAVSDVDSRSEQFGAHHYHHLNEDYEPIHRLCALFLAAASISEAAGRLPFSGFLLDMNKLFEKFVEQAFVMVGAKLGVEICPQKPEHLADSPFVRIYPDIIVACAGTTAAIVDAKYKRDASGPQNSDMFQVIAYGTALRCSDTYLFYPETELAVERTIPVRNSPIVVNTRRVAISGEDCIESAEDSVRAVLDRAALLTKEHIPAASA
jgi:5-methylcytosine-specific restriction enzyme subunit McrC